MRRSMPVLPTVSCLASLSEFHRREGSCAEGDALMQAVNAFISKPAPASQRNGQTAKALQLAKDPSEPLVASPGP
jgi:hypothetical protein